MKLENLKRLSLEKLKAIADDFGMATCGTKKDLVARLEQRYNDIGKYGRYTFLRQVGVEGKDARAFRVVDKQGNGPVLVMKVFKSSKSASKIQREGDLQRVAGIHGLAPEVVDINPDARYIVMEEMGETLFEVFRRQRGTLTLKQQREILALFEKLDRCGVFHGDPNPLNIMTTLDNKQWKVIDFGFARRITKRTKLGDRPNARLMTVGLILQLRGLYSAAALAVLEEVVKDIEG